MKTTFNNFFLFYLAFVFAALASSCNYTKHLTENQTLLKENKIELKVIKPIKYKGELESSIATLSNPQPNSHMLDLGILPKYKLWKYNTRHDYYVKNEKDPKITKRKVEKPVLVDTSLLARSKNNIKQFMINQGYFYTSVETEVSDVKNKEASIKYVVNAGKSYFNKSIEYEMRSSNLLSLLKINEANSYLKKGEIFTNFKCGLERDRIYKLFRNEGYYDFKSDNISFTIDTTDKSKLKDLLIDPLDMLAGYEATEKKQSNDSISVTVNIEQSRDSTFDTQYFINSVHVFLIDQSIPEDTTLPYIVTELDHVYFHYKTLPVNRNVIARNIFINEGEIYSTKAIEATTNRLNQLNVFQFVNIQFTKIKDSVGKLNCNIMLNTTPKMDFISTTELSNSNNYFLGIGASVTYRNRNLFHGANQLSISLSPSVEFRNDENLTGKKTFYNSGLNVNLNSSILFPKFIIPFNQNIFSKKNKPNTILGLVYSYSRIQQNYTMVNLSSQFGYNWRESETKTWKLNPIFLTRTIVSNLSDDYVKKIDSSIYLKSLFTSNIIQGENVTFEYQAKPHGLYQSYSSVRVTFEEAGTILQGINAISKSLANTNIDDIASYIKTEIDARKYIKRRKSEWVNRAYIGIGIPLFGNNSLPYIKQFSAGGSYSMRGWRIRTLGPGRSSDTLFQTSDNLIIDQTGDIKFELNTEYRFNLIKLFSGAIDLKGTTFMDAGNIWLANKNNSIPGGEFAPSYFLKDLALGAGVGLRLDFSFFILRVDLGFPLKQPNKTSVNGFNLKDLRLNDGIWVINFGYPF